MKYFIVAFLVFSVLFVTGKPLPILKTSENGKYLITEKNTPFLWLGDTAWELLHRLNLEESKEYLNDRKEKGFTVIQTVVLAELNGLNEPNANGDLPLINNDPAQFNEAYFKHVDKVIDLADELGLYVALLPTWGDKFNRKWGQGPVIFTPENAEKFGEMVAKRYKSSNNIIWVLGGDRAPENDTHFAIIRAMAAGIKKIDPQKLMSYHPVGATMASSYFNDDWLQIDMYQSGHSRTAKEYEYVWRSKKQSPDRPVINGEARYENIPDTFWDPGEHEWLDASDVRTGAYWTFLAGAAGYTYGCNDIWQMYAPGRVPSINARTGWKAALNLPGAQSMTHVIKFFENIPWQTLVNDQSLIASENPENNEFCMAAISSDKNYIVAYTPWGKPVTIKMERMESPKVYAWWYNPRSGAYTAIGEFTTQQDQSFTPWASGRGSDFVLLLSSRKLNL